MALPSTLGGMQAVTRPRAASLDWPCATSTLPIKVRRSPAAGGMTRPWLLALRPMKVTERRPNQALSFARLHLKYDLRLSRCSVERDRCVVSGSAGNRQLNHDYWEVGVRSSPAQTSRQSRLSRQPQTVRCFSRARGAFQCGQHRSRKLHGDLSKRLAAINSV